MIGQLLNAIFSGIFGEQGGLTTEATEQGAIIVEEERLQQEAERERQRKKTAPPGSQSLPKPVPTGPVPKPPTAPPLTPVDPDDDITVIPPAKGKAKDVNFAPNPGSPQKPIWEDPINAFRNWVFPSAGNTYVKLGTLLRNNYVKGDSVFYRWNRVIEPSDYFAQSKLSYSNFLAWLAKKTGAYNPETGDQGGQVDQFWDQSVTVWYTIAGQLDGRKGLIYGLEPLGMMFGEYFVLSRTAQFGGVRGMLYQSITVENSPAPWSRQPDNNLEDLDSEAGNGLAYGLAVNAAQTNDLINENGEVPKIILENNHQGGAGSQDAFPIRVPVSLLIEDEDLENMSEQEIQEKAYTKVKSLPELILWFVRVFDEVMGKFPLTFEIGESDMLSLEEEMQAWEQGVQKDGLQDPNLPFYLQNDKLVSFYENNGRRIKRIKVPNLAEALSELSALALVNDQNSALGQEFLTRILHETGSIKKSTLQCFYMIDAVIDWLGFTTKEGSELVNFSWNPILEPENFSMKNLLTPSDVPIEVVWENEKENFQKAINIIIEAHAILKAAHTEGIGAAPEVLAHRIRRFAEAFEPDPTIKKEAQPGEVIENSTTTEFDQFLERVEKGFIDAPGISDSEKPYGKPYGNRPKIRRVGGDLID